MMQFLGPVANLASSWLQGKADANAANAKLKLTEAEAKAKILLSKETSTAENSIIHCHISITFCLRKIAYRLGYRSH